MYKLNKLIANNKTLAWFLISLFEIIVFNSLLSSIDFSKATIVALSILLLLYNFLFVHSAQAQMLKKPLEALTNGCDPEPLLRVTADLLGGKQGDANRQPLLIDHAAALREMGEIDKAFEILSTLNIDKVSGTLPSTKVAYYNNLSDIYNLRGDTLQAEVWHQKMVQIYNDMPENKMKQMLHNTVALSTADSHYRCGDYGKAMALLNSVNPENANQRVAVYLLRGQIYLKLGNTEMAKKCLTEAVNKGNKLYAVRIAQKLLSEIGEA